MSVKIINIGIKTNVSYNAEGELWNIRCSKFDVQATGKTFKKAKIAREARPRRCRKLANFRYSWWSCSNVQWITKSYSIGMARKVWFRRHLKLASFRCSW